MRYYISSQCSRQKRIGEAVDELARLGFDRIELTGGTVWYEGIVDELERMRGRLAVDLMVHNYFPPQPSEFVLNLAVKDLGRRAQMMAFVREALVLARRFGSRVYGIHPGFRQDVAVEQEANGFFRAGDPTATSEDAFYEAVDELDALAAKEGVLIAIENLAPRSKEDPFSFLTTEEDLRRFLPHVAAKRHLGLLLDFGHAGAAGATFGVDPKRLLDLAFDSNARVLELHLSENHGSKDAHAVTSPGSWQLDYLKSHRSALGDIPVVFEWSNAATPATFHRFREIVTQLES